MKCNSLSPLLIVIILASLFLSGCGTLLAGPTPTPTSVPTLTPTLTSTPTLTPTLTQTPTLPTPTPFIPKATIKIVSHSPLSGDASVPGTTIKCGADQGTDIMCSAELAVQQLANPLTELGYKIELVPYNDQSSIKVAVAHAKEIVVDPEILCGVGHYDSFIMQQTSEIYHKAGLAFVSPANTATTITARGYLEVNRIVGRNDGQGVAGAQFAGAQGFTTIFIISNGSDYSKQNVAGFKLEAKRLGLQLVGTVVTDQMEKFEALVTKVIATNPDLVYITSFADQGGAFFREARAAGYMGAFLGLDVMDTPELVEIAGPLLTDGGGMYYTNMAAPASLYPDAIKFVEDFYLNYGAEPQLFGAQAYDAAGICLKAIEEASKAKNGEIPTRAEVANAIRALQDYKGITGTYTFNGKGDLILAKYFVFKVVSVDPNNWNQNTLVTSFDVAPPR